LEIKPAGKKFGGQALNVDIKLKVSGSGFKK